MYNKNLNEYGIMIAKEPVRFIGVLKVETIITSISP